MCRILKISSRCLSRLLIRQMCRILKISCLCLSRLFESAWITIPIPMPAAPAAAKAAGALAPPTQAGAERLPPVPPPTAAPAAAAASRSRVVGRQPKSSGVSLEVRKFTGRRGPTELDDLLGAKLSAGGIFVSVLGRCSVWSAPLQ